MASCRRSAARLGARNVMANNAQDVLNQARATLARLDGIEDEFAARNSVRDRTFEPLRRVRPQSAQKEALQMTQQPNWDDWNEWCRTIAAELVGELADEAGQACGELSREIAELREELAQLRASIEVERAARNSNVVDLPDWRKRGAA